MIDKKDLVILSHLRKDARMGLTEMSRSSKVPVSTLHDKLKLFRGTYIVKNTALLNFASIGFSTRASILLRVHPKDKDRLREHLLKQACINSMARINNGYDYHVDAVFRGMRELEEFVDKLQNEYDIRSKQIFFVIDDIKREGFLAEPELAELAGAH